MYSQLDWQDCSHSLSGCTEDDDGDAGGADNAEDLNGGARARSGKPGHRCHWRNLSLPHWPLRRRGKGKKVSAGDECSRRERR